MTHICVGKSTIIGSDNGLPPDRRQAIIGTNAGILLIGPLGREILTGIQTFSFKKMHLKMSSAQWRPFCLGLNELNTHANDNGFPYQHDDVIKWKHFPRNWPIVRRIHRRIHKGQWRGALMFSLICTWINSWVNNPEAGDLRRHRAHCDVSVMSSECWQRVWYNYGWLYTENTLDCVHTLFAMTMHNISYFYTTRMTVKKTILLCYALVMALPSIMQYVMGTNNCDASARGGSNYY